MGHVRTFDRLHHDFSGSCLYLLAGLCPGTQGPEPFRVLVRGGLGGITGAEVLVRRTRVELEPGRVTEPCAPIPNPIPNPIPVPKSVPNLVPNPVPNPATCSALGMGHVRTFDRLHHDFSGSCLYLLAGLCPASTGWPWPWRTTAPTWWPGAAAPPGAHPAFDVTVTDPPRGGPGPRSVAVTVHQHRFVLRGGHPGVVEVDGSKVSLPFCLRGQAVCLAPRGATTLLVADFGLRVTAGPGVAVAVTVSPSFRNVTCGLCGNFDGHPYNDHLHQATTATCHRPCPGPTCPPCRQPPKKAFVHTELCGVLRDPQGPFGGCHAAVHPRVFFDVCLWELCEAPGDKEVLNEVLGAYEAACRQAKVRVGPWRVPSVCPPWCVEGSGCRPGVTCVPHRALLRRDLSPGALLGALPLRGLGLTPLLPGVLPPPNLPLGLQPPPLGPLAP
eukprot:XP_027303091.1 IgGFc-binding protein-like [Anas platyrhynchos]